MDAGSGAAVTASAEDLAPATSDEGLNPGQPPSLPVSATVPKAAADK